MNAWLPILGSSTPVSSGTPALEYVSTAGDTTDLSTYTFSALSLGAAAADRKIAICIFGRLIGGTTAAVTSVTVDGISATVKRTNTGIDTTNSGCCEIWLADVPTGTTGDVVVNLNATMTRCIVGLYKLTGITGTAYATNAFHGTSAVATITCNTNVANPSVTVFMGVWSGAVTASSLTGLTEDFESAPDTTNYVLGSYTSAAVETPRSMVVNLSGTSTLRFGTAVTFN